MLDNNQVAVFHGYLNLNNDIFGIVTLAKNIEEDTYMCSSNVISKLIGGNHF